MTKRLSDYKALTFDCYGTLIDWETGMVNGLKPLTDQMAKPLDRDQICEAHARHESSQQAWTPAMKYSDLLAIVYKRLAEEWRIDVSWAACQTYGASVKDWPAFPDSAKALSYLKQHFKLVILSNVDNASFAGSNARLGIAFDAIYTAEDVGSYKPNLRNFDYMLDKLKAMGLEASDVLHTAESMFHDHGPANASGLANCWIYRRHDKDGFGATMNPLETTHKVSGQMPTYSLRFNSMADLVMAHKAELAG